MARHKTYTDSHLVKLRAGEKQDLSAMATAAGVTLSDAFREGAKEYLLARLPDHQVVQDAAGGDDDLAAELLAVTSRIDRRLRGGR